MDKFPKISIVTISFNQAAFLEETINAVLGQNYPNLEYIIIDGQSTDGSTDIIRRYENRLHYWVSEKDGGMYEALQKGFDKSSGEIMGWINSDDLLHPGSLHLLAKLFSEYPACNWIEGRNIVINEQGQLTNECFPFNTTKFAFYNWNFLDAQKRNIRAFGTLQQESTYWRRSLWEKAGAKLDTSLKTAGDFELWMRFFRYEPLFVVDEKIGAFRSRTAQKSIANKNVYVEEAIAVVDRELAMLSAADKKILKKINRLERHPLLKKLPGNTAFYSRHMRAEQLKIK